MSLGALHEVFEEEDNDLEKVESRKNLVDPLTKPLSAAKHWGLLQRCGMRVVPAGACREGA